MERSLNKVELKGVIGVPRVEFLGNNFVCKFALATHEAFKGKDGEYKELTTWHRCYYYSARSMPTFNELKKGDFVELVGKLVYQHYTNATGESFYGAEVLALKLSNMHPQQIVLKKTPAVQEDYPD